MKIICVDFDGVIHSYTSGWKGIANIPDPPVDGAILWLEEQLHSGEVEIMIYSSRSRNWKGRRAMRQWFMKYLGRYHLRDLSFPKKKPAASLTIDDRAICFKGVFPTTAEMVTFEPWKQTI